MNRNKILACFILLIIFTSADKAFAFQSRKDYFLKPQVGVWFGPITPLYTTADELDTSLGGGLYFRYNLPYKSLKIGLDASYQYFSSAGINELHFVPVYTNLIYTLPLNIPIKLQLKGGLGGGYLHILPEDKGRWDPVFMIGAEMSFPAGRFVNIGLRIDYIHIYEGYLAGSEVNGHILNTGIVLYFNLNI